MSNVEWKLTPAERRMAEVAFASAFESDNAHERAFKALAAVRDLRGESWRHTTDERDAMLAELRCEPAPVCSQRVVSTSFVSAREGRYRALLERIVKAVDNRGLDYVDSNGDDLLDALDDARKELGR